MCGHLPPPSPLQSLPDRPPDATPFLEGQGRAPRRQRMSKEKQEEIQKQEEESQELER